MNMLKQAAFLYRSFSRAHAWHKGMKARRWMLGMASAVLMAGLLWTPFSVQAIDATATPAATPTMAAPTALLTQTPTPFPPEFAGNSQQTIGVTFAGAILVLIVVIGVMAYLPQKKDD